MYCLRQIPKLLGQKVTLNQRGNSYQQTFGANMDSIDVQRRARLKFSNYKIDNHNSPITGDRSFLKMHTPPQILRDSSLH